ncbi:conserved oligomeric Golgi complex subunit 3 isoform X1 [Tanacetum coccineum]
MIINAPLTEQQHASIFALSHAVVERPFPSKLGSISKENNGLSVSTKPGTVEESGEIDRVLVNTNQRKLLKLPMKPLTDGQTISSLCVSGSQRISLRPKNNLNTCTMVSTSKKVSNNGDMYEYEILNEQSKGKNGNKSFADTFEPNITDAENKLSLIPMSVEEGREKMSYYELREIDGLNHVLQNGPWMVSNKPCMVQKWDPSVIIDRREPEVLPCWIKLYNVPLNLNMGGDENHSDTEEEVKEEEAIDKQEVALPYTWNCQINSILMLSLHEREDGVPGQVDS